MSPFCVRASHSFWSLSRTDTIRKMHWWENGECYHYITAFMFAALIDVQIAKQQNASANRLVNQQIESSAHSFLNASHPIVLCAIDIFIWLRIIWLTHLRHFVSFCSNPFCTAKKAAPQSNSSFNTLSQFDFMLSLLHFQLKHSLDLFGSVANFAKQPRWFVATRIEFHWEQHNKYIVVGKYLTFINWIIDIIHKRIQSNQKKNVCSGILISIHSSS